MAGTEQQEVVYVLGSRLIGSRAKNLKREYYTGEAPTQRLSEAKTYDTREKAINVRKYAKTGPFYHVMKTNRKRIFKAALEDK